MTLDQSLLRLAAWQRPVRLIATGGGTGGHTYPAITTIRATRELLQGAGVALDVLYVGSAGGVGTPVAARGELPLVGGVPRQVRGPTKTPTGDFPPKPRGRRTAAPRRVEAPPRERRV